MVDDQLVKYLNLEDVNFQKKLYIFRNLKLEIALAITASNYEKKFETIQQDSGEDYKLNEIRLISWTNISIQSYTKRY